MNKKQTNKQIIIIIINIRTTRARMTTIAESVTFNAISVFNHYILKDYRPDLFIYGLFNDDGSSTNYIASNEGV
jgi:hypothetical protein